MITLNNFKEMLKALDFSSNGDIYSKEYKDFDCCLQVDFKKKEIIYPEDKGLKINEKQTCNLSSNENFVVLECVNRLIEKGYNPRHIELEPKWKVGHGASGGRADILVRDNNGKALLIIECKIAGNEYTKHWNETLENGSQLFGYAQQERDAKYLCLYASNFIDNSIKSEYYLISLVDNKAYLLENPLLKSYNKAKIREDLFNIWCDSYHKDYTTKGIFEKDIQAYNIGKQKYTVNDLAVIDDISKTKIHNKFATILRKYNVSGRENAFDKLINLFLCKIVDEKQNPTDLRFYWKGVAYDTAYELQDRLQKLYKEGMGNFLKEKVTYIDNDQINNAFRFFKNDPDSTRDTIKEYFKQLKFFTNNDFAFIDVHNERLFHENSKVLIDIVRLFQDTKLKSNDKNQFLGDMFENFLDSGVKQSEGQFFTPMPITRFIIQSLPLENIIKNSQKPPKAIDYACGSGHFLNELASQMEPFIKENKDVKIEDYHKAIYGIEKEYRLSKVAKVSSFMYGQDNINITYSDGLVQHEAIKENDFKILIANPPYSVKGFLGTISKDERDRYDLSKSVDDKSVETNNSIECFFIERAKQLLENDGVAAIIVPPSLMSNADSTYIGTREILLKYFDIVAIAEFGTGTFGKTGTNTITLFLRRKCNKPSLADHYRNRVDSWFSGANEKETIFEDKYFLEEYCKHIKIKYEDYKTLLNAKPNVSLLDTQIFKDYRLAFDKLNTTKKKKKQTIFKKQLKQKQEEILSEEFVKYLYLIEKEKLYYFILASNNSNAVVIIHGPENNKSNRKYLGYEWSSAKGSEGIKLYKDELDRHLTPLYDEDNRNNINKINYYIEQAFLGNKPVIVDELTEFISRSSLVDMLDFTRVGFNKEISLNPNQIEKEIDTQWTLIPLGEVCYVKIGGTPDRKNLSFYKGNNLWVSIAEMKGNSISSTKETISDKAIKESNVKLIPKGTTLLSFKLSIGKTAFAGCDLYTNEAIAGLIPKDDKIKDEYLFHLFDGKIINLENVGNKSFGKSLNSTFLKEEVKIPMPPSNIQKKIIDECNIVSAEINRCHSLIKDSEKNITKLYIEAQQKSENSFKLSNEKDFDIRIGKRILKNETSNSDIVIPIYSANVFDVFGFTTKNILDDFSSPSILWGIDGDWLVNDIAANKAFYPTDHCGVLRVKTTKINIRYLTRVIKEEGQRKRFSRTYRASVGRIKGLEISLPSINIQTEFVKALELSEKEILSAKKVISCVTEKKREILKKYL